MRIFQSRDGKRFWNIDVGDSWLTISSGFVETEGRTAAKQLSTPSRAQTTTEKIVRKKTATAKGWLSFAK